MMLYTLEAISCEAIKKSEKPWMKPPTKMRSEFNLRRAIYIHNIHLGHPPLLVHSQHPPTSRKVT